MFTEPNYGGPTSCGLPYLPRLNCLPYVLQGALQWVFSGCGRLPRLPQPFLPPNCGNGSYGGHRACHFSGNFGGSQVEIGRQWYHEPSKG